MRVNDHIGNYAFSSEWQVFLSIGHTACTFLTVTTGEFVTDLRDSDSSHFYLRESLILFICSNDDLVNYTALSML